MNSLTVLIVTGVISLLLLPFRMLIGYQRGKTYPKTSKLLVVSSALISLMVGIFTPIFFRSLLRGLVPQGNELGFFLTSILLAFTYFFFILRMESAIVIAVYKKRLQQYYKELEEARRWQEVPAEFRK